MSCICHQLCSVLTTAAQAGELTPAQIHVLLCSTASQQQAIGRAACITMGMCLIMTCVSYGQCGCDRYGLYVMVNMQ